MGAVDLRQLLGEGLRKYRGVLIILLAGILLMALPTGNPKAKEGKAEQPAVQEESLAQELEALLAELQGAGEVRVLLSRAQGERVRYQVDEDKREGELRRTTVLVQGDSRGENGLIRQVDPPVYLGAVVLCQGGDQPSLRLSIVDAVTSVTGLGSDRVTVLKMK